MLSLQILWSELKGEHLCELVPPFSCMCSYLPNSKINDKTYALETT